MRTLVIVFCALLSWVHSGHCEPVCLKANPGGEIFWGQTPEQITDIEGIPIADMERTDSVLWGRMNVEFMGEQYSADISFAWDKENEIWRLKTLYFSIPRVDDRTDFRDIRKTYERLGYSAIGWTKYHNYQLVRGVCNYLVISNDEKSDKTLIGFRFGSRCLWPEYRRSVSAKDLREFDQLKIVSENLTCTYDSTWIRVKHFKGNIDDNWWCGKGISSDAAKLARQLNDSVIILPGHYRYDYDQPIWRIEIKNVSMDRYYNGRTLWARLSLWNKYFGMEYGNSQKFEIELGPQESTVYRVYVSYNEYLKSKDGTRVIEFYNLF